MPATETEPTLAEMEYSMRSPEGKSLYDYDVGFEEMESDDNGEKAMGVRLFKVGKNYWYGPAFFDSGQMRGDELLWSKRDKMFVPFVEEWNNYILKGRSDDMGDQWDGQIAVSEPDLSPMYEAPPVGTSARGGTVKTAGVSLPEDMVPTVDIRDVRATVKRANTILAQDRWAGVDLEGALQRAGRREKLAACDMLMRNPKVAEILLNRSPGLVDLLDPGDSPEARKSAQVPGAAPKAQPKTKLVEGVSEDYEQPADTGIYRIHESGGGTREVLVIRVGDGGASYAVNGGMDDDVLLVDPESRSAGAADSLSLMAEQDAEQKQTWGKWWDALDGDDVRKNNAYVFVGKQQGQATNIIEVEEKTSKSNGQVVLSVFYTPLTQSITSDETSQESVRQAVITEGDGQHVISDGRLIIPDGYKAIRLKKQGSPSGFQSNPLPQFATPEDVMLHHGTPMRVSKDAMHESLYVIECDGERDRVSGRRGAKSVLTGKYGMTEKSAGAVLSDHEKWDREMFMVKRSQMLPPMEQQMIPPGGPAGPPPMAAGGGPAGPPGGPPAPMGPPPRQLAPEAQKAIDAALAAEENGTEGPIETAIFSNMLDVSDDARLIRENLGHLLKAVDALGTILYRIYADWDEFEEDMGGQELNDLVDQIKEVFIGQGKLIIRLKEKLSGPEDLRISLG